MESVSEAESGVIGIAGAGLVGTGGCCAQIFVLQKRVRVIRESFMVEWVRNFLVDRVY